MISTRIQTLSLAFAAVAFLFAPMANAAKPAAAKTATVTLKIANLTKATTAKEVKKVEKALKKVKGVTFVIVAKKKGEITIKHKPTADLAAIKETIKKAGFSLVEPKADDGEEAADDAAADDDMAGDDTAGDDDMADESADE